MDLNAVDRYDESLAQFAKRKAELIQELTDLKNESLTLREKAIKFVAGLPKKGTTVIRALSGNYYVSDGTDLAKAENVIVSAEDDGVVET